MASFFELPVLSEFLNFVVPFLLVFALVYAVLSKTQALSESSSVNSVIAFVIAFITAMAAGKFLLALAPFFVTFLIMLVGVVMLLAFVGYKPEVLMESKAFVYGVMIAGILFVVTTAWLVYQQPIQAQLGNFTQGNASVTQGNASGIIHGTYYDATNASINATTNITKTEACSFYNPTNPGAGMWCMLTNPKVLGMIIVVAIMAIVTWFFARERLEKKE
jgi:hypothetical protein